jgi:hypothetical protein
MMGTMVASGEVKKVRVERLLDAPIITPATDPSIGENIQGPSLVRVPDWVENRLGRYYLYFADHKGSYIRLAYADDLKGPWKVHPPGSLQIADSYFPSEPPAIPPGELEKYESRLLGSSTARRQLPHSLAKEATAPHIASPDVHVDDGKRRFIMYFHGLNDFSTQLSRMALSEDGVHFKGRPETIDRTYLRAFHYDGMTYGIAMPGQVYRSKDGLSGFEKGPLLFNPDMRHCALLRRGDTLYAFWTQVGAAPEVIQLSTIDLSRPWMEWRESDPLEVLRPERDWEGADQPVKPSMRSVAYGKVNQLRDPAIYEEGDRVYLLYAVAGESGIAIAEVFLED